jgi:hypothetical protein
LGKQNRLDAGFWKLTGHHCVHVEALVGGRLVLISEALEVDLGPRGVPLIFLHRRLMSAFSLTARSFAMS